MNTSSPLSLTLAQCRYLESSGSCESGIHPSLKSQAGTHVATGSPDRGDVLEGPDPQLQASTRPLPARTLTQSALERDVFEDTQIAGDFYRICYQHQYADGPFQVAPVPPCPVCEIAGKWRQGYDLMRSGSIAIR